MKNAIGFSTVSIAIVIATLGAATPSHTIAATSRNATTAAEQAAPATDEAPNTAQKKDAEKILYATPAPLEEGFVRAKQNGAKQTLGWLQSIRLLPYKVRLTAKLDTGAKSSVIHAINVKPLKKGGKSWVRFTVLEEKKKGGQVIMPFELPVVDKSRVKQHHIDELDERYVVEMDFCMDGRVYKAEFSLDNREKFNYPVLLGRDFLGKFFVVDPSKTFVAKYNCLPDE